jgi:hypothetical protein
MRYGLVAGFVVLSGLVSGADSVVIPLVDPGDPLRIVGGRIEFEDDIRPVMLVELENATGQPIETTQVWLQFARFFTKGEMNRAGDRKVWDCATATAAGSKQALQVIQPGERVTIRAAISSSCQNNRDHEHFFVGVTRVGDSTSPSFRRKPEDLVRLLNAAQPHP